MAANPIADVLQMMMKDPRLLQNVLQQVQQNPEMLQGFMQVIPQIVGGSTLLQGSEPGANRSAMHEKDEIRRLMGRNPEVVQRQYLTPEGQRARDDDPYQEIDYENNVLPEELLTPNHPEPIARLQPGLLTRLAMANPAQMQQDIPVDLMKTAMQMRHKRQPEEDIHSTIMQMLEANPQLAEDFNKKTPYRIPLEDINFAQGDYLPDTPMDEEEEEDEEEDKNYKGGRG